MNPRSFSPSSFPRKNTLAFSSMELEERVAPPARPLNASLGDMRAPACRLTISDRGSQPPRSSLTRALLIATVCGMPAGCGDGDSGTGPTEGSIEVTAITAGTELDPDGYTVAVDGGISQTLPINGSLTLSSLASGEHSLALSDVASNCVVAGSNPRNVTVPAGSSAEVTFTVSCGLTITVVTTTTGTNPDADGYTVALDGVGTGSIAVTGTLTLTDVPPGDHTVRLDNVAEHCAVAGENPREVTIPPSAEVAFAITCGEGTITFWSDRDGDPEIYVVEADGTGLKVLTDMTTSDQNYDPKWSPDGARIIFWSNRLGDGLWIMNADGSDQHQVTTEGFEPDWSPDGSQIVFASSDLLPQIYIVNADGSDPTPVGSDPGPAGEPAWSPDGTKIAFVSRRDGNPEIYVMNTDGSNPINLTNSSADERRPDWSPDGTAIAFASDRDGNFEIYVMEPDGSNPTNLTQNEAFDFSPAWSPDGTALAFASDREFGINIYKMQADGSQPTQVTDSPGARDDDPDWTP